MKIKEYCLIRVTFIWYKHTQVENMLARRSKEKNINAKTHLKYINYISLASFFVGHRHISAKPDQTPQNAASDQVLHCLLTEVSFKI